MTAAVDAASVEVAAAGVAPPLGRDPRARLAELLDQGTVATVEAPGVVTAVGRIDGQPVTAFATDPSVQGGAMGSEGCAAIVSAYDDALVAGRPVVGIWHSGGARLGEGAMSLDGVGRIFAVMTRASGRVPQVSVVLGPAAGGAAYGPALTDVVVLGPAGRIFVTGPDVVRSVTGEEVDMARLGGPEPHERRSGVVHLSRDSDEEALGAAREVVGLLGGDRATRPRLHPVADRPLARCLPASVRRAYDVHPLLDGLLDEPMLELQPRWARNLVTGLGRLGGAPIGIVANNPLHLAGCLDAASAEKGARFVRTCDAFGVPLLVVVDVPGYLPGVGQEWDGVVRRGAKLLHAFAEARVPRVTVVTRKAFGGAYIAMNSRSLGASRVLAWPDAEIAVMGHVAAVRILRRRELAALPEQHRPAAEVELAAAHAEATGGVARAVELGLVDEVVDPDHTRSTVGRILAEHVAGRGEHGNIPL